MQDGKYPPSLNRAGRDEFRYERRRRPQSVLPLLRRAAFHSGAHHHAQLVSSPVPRGVSKWSPPRVDFSRLQRQPFETWACWCSMPAARAIRSDLGADPSDDTGSRRCRGTLQDGNQHQEDLPDGVKWTAQSLWPGLDHVRSKTLANGYFYFMSLLSCLRSKWMS
jgi:hypothetical protein